jgi:hypothetical protein
VKNPASIKYFDIRLFLKDSLSLFNVSLIVMYQLAIYDKTGSRFIEDLKMFTKGIIKLPSRAVESQEPEAEWREIATTDYVL